jgi:protease IV
VVEAEAIVERRRMKRRLTLWRIAAVVLGIGLLMIIALRDDDSGAGALRPHVARVDVSGIITDDRKVHELLERLGDSAQVQAVIMNINSPGGTTTGGEALYDAIRRLADKKPVVAVCGTLATSAAYMAAIATDRIFVHGNTITGSVGVIFQWADVSELLKSIGIEVEEVKSGPLKAVPSPFQPTDQQGIEMTQELVEDAKNWFISLVADRRDLRPNSVPGLTEGRIYSGRQAVTLKLADQIGDEKTAQTWLEENRDVTAGLKVREWKPRSERLGVIGRMFESLASSFGLPKEMLALIDTIRTGNRLHLDGLVSLWHPASHQ